MNDTDPRGKRGRVPRKTPRYTRAQLQELRISRVHSRDKYLFCLLSDGNMVRIPLPVAPALAASPQGVRIFCELGDDGKAVFWHSRAVGKATERLSLLQILADPDAQITILPRALEPVPVHRQRGQISNSVASWSPFILGMLTSAMTI